MIVIRTYKATLKHDGGKHRLRVTSMSGEETAIKMIMTAEGCPRCAIVKIRELKSKRKIVK